MKQHILLPDTIAAIVPPLDAQEPVEDKIAYVQFILPVWMWVWLLCEYEPHKQICFGYVYDELARFEPLRFSLRELEELNVYNGHDEVEKQKDIYVVKRNLYFYPQKVSEAKATFFLHYNHR